MSQKLTFTTTLNWASSLPPYFQPNAPQSGVTQGVMTGTSTIYSQPLDVNLKDNIGLEVTWTGTPTGTIQVLGSSSGNTYYPLTFNPILTQPAGSAGGYLIDLNQFPWRYLSVEYTNSSGTGVLLVTLTAKDIN